MKLGSGMARISRRTLVIAVALVCALLGVGLWLFQGVPKGDPVAAKWATRDRITAQTVGFLAEVEPLSQECGAHRATLNPPTIVYGPNAVTLSFTADPPGGAQNCFGFWGRTPENMKYQVELKDPLGDRKLVDGNEPDGEGPKRIWGQTFE